MTFYRNRNISWNNHTHIIIIVIPHRADPQCVGIYIGYYNAIFTVNSSSNNSCLNSSAFSHTVVRMYFYFWLFSKKLFYIAGNHGNAVTFVPVSWRRNYARGFDQARLLAEETAKIWGVRAEPTLRKIRHTKAQSSLEDPALRTGNVKGAYAVPRPDRVRGRRLLLIDDVCTTGSTMAAAAEALLEAGAASVVCAALAGGHQKVQKPGEGLHSFGEF